MTGNIPSARTGHSAVVVSERYILIRGGYDPYFNSEQNDIDHHLEDKTRIVYYNDRYILDTQTWMWYSGIESLYTYNLPVIFPGVSQDLKDAVQSYPDDLHGSVWSSTFLIPNETANTLLKKHVSSEAYDSYSKSTDLIVLNYGGLAKNNLKTPSSIQIERIGNEFADSMKLID